MQYVLAKMTLASARRVSSDTGIAVTAVEARAHLERSWAALLHQFGMCTSCGQSAVDVSQTGTIYGMPTTMSVNTSECSEVFRVAFNMLATTKRERGSMTVAEADIMRQFFKDVAGSSR